MAQRFFALKDDARLLNHVADARGFLTRTRERYDLIFMDVFHSITLPVHVTTREYFDLARERLTPDGIVVSNVVSDLGAEPPSLLGSLALTFETAFPGALYFAVESIDTKRRAELHLRGLPPPATARPRRLPSCRPPPARKSGRSRSIAWPPATCSSIDSGC